MTAPLPIREQPCTALAKLAVEQAIAELMVMRMGREEDQKLPPHLVQQKMFEGIVAGVLGKSARAKRTKEQDKQFASVFVFQSGPSSIWTNPKCVMPVIMGLADSVARDIDLMRDESPMFKIAVSDGDGLLNGLVFSSATMRYREANHDAAALIFAKIVAYSTLAVIWSPDQAAVGYASACRLAGKAKT